MQRSRFQKISPDPRFLGREVGGKGRGYRGARKVVCPGARTDSRRAWSSLLRQAPHLQMAAY